MYIFVCVHIDPSYLRHRAGMILKKIKNCRKQEEITVVVQLFSIRSNQ